MVFEINVHSFDRGLVLHPPRPALVNTVGGIDRVRKPSPLPFVIVTIVVFPAFNSLTNNVVYYLSFPASFVLVFILFVSITFDKRT